MTFYIESGTGRKVQKGDVSINPNTFYIESNTGRQVKGSELIQTFTTPSGAIVDVQGNLISPPSTETPLDVNNQTNNQSSVFTSDPNIQSQISTLPPEIQGVIQQLSRQLEKRLEGGEQLNPQIIFTPERLKEFTDQATTELEPYYQEVMNQAKGDIEISLNRLSEDYKRGISRAEEPFKEGLATQAESEAQAGLTYGSERGLRERQNVQSQQRSLDDVFRTVERGVQDTTRQGERQLGSDFLSGLQSPQFSPFTASTQGFQQTTPRTVFNLQGGLMGEKPKQRKVDIRTRAQDLEDITRRNLILDRSNL